MDETTLKSLVAKVAKTELGEDEHTRNESLREFRDWIEKNPGIENCKIDEIFLLYFLRGMKFNVSLAKQRLLNMLMWFNESPDTTCKWDCLDPAVNGLISDGYLFASPQRDEHGRQILICRGNKIRTDKFSYKDISHVLNVTVMTMGCEDANQVLGIVIFVDFSNLTGEQATIWPIMELVRFCRAIKDCCPMRFKEIHFLNVPSIATFLLNSGLSILSEKLQKRICFHSSLEELHKRVSSTVLPQEYGGNMPAKDMIDLWKQKLVANRQLVMQVEEWKLVDNNDGQIIDTGSFRTLNVD